ncbi:uncharacterized protein M421DRAFT_1578 [Didymella exigua CBS 183.55]|uniref:Uncharacterized protein n=1 Tax=Didymella exigua CBS 183.55 TaxID=1150837 RepID=A0A6A5RWY7_9PLEO|nr:uncharacterized protein M421DRAFT_1578 [Didymella exigua CBS 183.55]KAF1933005.1 hypothetical protein M421DRAFT_1578 [Didymella exigua CBS 183.55]
MASISAEAARPVQKQQARRPVSRIVPAIPLRLSRKAPAARPITPEESHKGLVTQLKQEPEPQPQPQPPALEERTVEEQPAEAAQTPLTPESKTSVEVPEAEAEVEAPVLTRSPAKSLDAEVTRAAEAQAPALTDAPSHLHEARPAAPVDSKPLTNGVHRKELPPAFVPSSMSGMSTPVAENHDNVFHPARPSVDGPMGGFMQDSPAQPATPHGYETGGHGHRQSVPRIPPGFAPPDFTPSFFPGHSHHPSDAGAPWLYPPYSMPPPPEQMYGNGSEFQSPPFTAGPSAYPDPYQSAFSLEDPRFAANGIATSHSQSPSKSQFGEALPVADRVEVQHAQPQQNGAGPRNDEMIESPFELASYLSTQFGNPEFADFVLQVRSPELQYISVPVHGIVVVRSPVIANAVRRSIPPAHRSRDSRRLVDVLTTNPFVGNESIQEAVKVLYGAPLLSMQAFLYGLGHYTSEVPHPQASKDARRRMDQLLSYVAAGSVLKIPSMQARGVEIAKALLRWDTVERVLHYGLHAARTAPRPNADGAEVHDPFAAELLNSAVEFIAYNFPADFNFYRIASELQDDPRLPSLTEARASSHNPRLSKIRFGDAPTDDDAQISPVSRTLSSILLSLPLPLLDRLFNHRATANQIGWTGAAKVLHSVVDERESRRQKAVRAQLQLDSAAPSALMDNLYVEERVEHVGPSPVHPSGYMLSAHRANGQA